MRNLPQNFIENAVSVFKRFTQNLPEDFEEKTQKIIEETKRKKARGANPVLKKLHEEGNTLFRTQEFEKAKKVYEDAINLIDFQSEEGFCCFFFEKLSRFLKTQHQILKTRGLE